MLENLSPIGVSIDGDVLLRREDYFWLLKQAEKAEQYEKILKTIAEHEYCGSIGATGYYAEFKAMAKNALEVNEQ
ncbi:hypothetical protein [Anoxybacillus flavithermus]|nr:hypothetical protein [Anoxybacillus flavithermus]